MVLIVTDGCIQQCLDIFQCSSQRNNTRLGHVLFNSTKYCIHIVNFHYVWVCNTVLFLNLFIRADIQKKFNLLCGMKRYTRKEHFPKDFKIDKGDISFAIENTLSRNWTRLIYLQYRHLQHFWNMLHLSVNCWWSHQMKI